MAAPAAAAAAAEIPKGEQNRSTVPLNRKRAIPQSPPCIERYVTMILAWPLSLLCILLALLYVVCVYPILYLFGIVLHVVCAIVFSLNEWYYVVSIQQVIDLLQRLFAWIRKIKTRHHDETIDS